MPIRKEKQMQEAESDTSWHWTLCRKLRTFPLKWASSCPWRCWGREGALWQSQTPCSLFSVFYWSIVDLRGSISFWDTKQSDSVIKLSILFIVFSIMVYFRTFSTVPWGKRDNGTCHIQWFACFPGRGFGLRCFARAFPSCGEWGLLSFRCEGFLLWRLLLVQSAGSRLVGYSSCRTWKLAARRYVES